MPSKQVSVKVVTDKDLKGVQAIEDRIRKIKQEKIRLDIQANTEKLNSTEQRIKNLKIFLDNVNTGNTNIHIDDSDIKKAEEELSALEAKKIDIELEVETSKLEHAKNEVEEMDGKEIHMEASMGMQNISQGFAQAKQGVSELGDKVNTALTSAGKQETNKTFLELAVGADTAGKKMEEINGIVQKLPGDDTVLQGLLSSAVAKDANLTSDALSAMGSSAADYFAAMSYYGKSASEAQQDMTNYLLAGNTAELERSPILQGHIDKLKEANTVEERAKVLAEALNEEHWGGISTQDTYNNKLETFNGMLERGQYTLGGMFQEGAKGAMDFALKLDEASGGLVGIGLAAGGMLSPLTDIFMGLGQMATGMKAIKDLGMVQYLKDLEITTKLSAAAQYLHGVATAVYGAIVGLLTGEIGLATAAQMVWNAVMDANPIMIVVLALIALAAALIWAYNNVDWFREMVDNAWASLQLLASQIIGAIGPAIEWIGGLFNQFTSQLGLNTNDWVQAILGFILFIPTLPIQIGIALANAIAKVLGFGPNFVQNLVSSATNAVNGFINKIRELPGMIQSEFARIEGIVSNFITSLPQRVWDLGASIVGALKGALGIGSPGHMFYMFEGEIKRIKELPGRVVGGIKSEVTKLGTGIVESFKPQLDFEAPKIPNLDGFDFNADHKETLNNVLNEEANENTGGQTIINLNMEIGSVDNEKRIQEIVDAVKRELSWNNATAGRTV